MFRSISQMDKQRRLGVLSETQNRTKGGAGEGTKKEDGMRSMGERALSTYEAHFQGGQDTLWKVRVCRWLENILMDIQVDTNGVKEL